MHALHICWRETYGAYRIIGSVLADILDSELMSQEIASRLRKAIGEAGYAIVPMSPTNEMLEAARPDALAEDAAGVWSSMIAAAKY